MTPIDVVEKTKPGVEASKPKIDLQGFSFGSRMWKTNKRNHKQAETN